MTNVISWAATCCLLLALMETTSGKSLSIRLAARQKRSLPPPNHTLGGDVHLIDADGHSVNDPDHLNPENAALHTINEFVTELKPETEEENKSEKSWWELIGEYIWEYPKTVPEEPDIFDVEEEFSGEQGSTHENKAN